MKVNVNANNLNCTKIGFLASYANYHFKKQQNVGYNMT